MKHTPYYPPVGATGDHLHFHDSLNPDREYVYYDGATLADQTSHHVCLGYSHEDHKSIPQNDSPTRARSMCNRVGGAAKEREVRGGRGGSDGHEWRERREGRGLRSSRDLREYVVTVDETAPPRLPEKHFDCRQTACCVACLSLVSCMMLMGIVLLTLTTLPLYAIALTSRAAEVVRPSSYENAPTPFSHKVAPLRVDGLESGTLREGVQDAAVREINYTERDTK